MRTPTDPVDPAGSRSTDLALARDHHLILETGRKDRSLVRLEGPQGICLAIEITEAGPVLRFEGPGLAFHAAGALTISADSVSIQARRGDVRVTANDDVKLNGERVLLNC